MAARPTAGRSGARTVLIVDDDPATCLTFGEALRLAGLRVETAETGSQTFVPIDHQAVKELRRLLGGLQEPVH